MRHLSDLADESARLRGRPDLVAVTFPGTGGQHEGCRDSWRDDPYDAVVQAVAEKVAELGLDVDPPPATRDLVAVLKHYTRQLDAEILLILDQFEEYLLYHQEEFEPGTFADGLVGVLNHAALGVNVLIAIREDAYTSLDRFKGRIPLLYENYLRVGHLSLEKARRAIEQPVQRFNELVPGSDMHVAPDLIDEVLKQFQSGDVALGADRQGGRRGGAQGPARRRGADPPARDGAPVGGRARARVGLAAAGHADRARRRRANRAHPSRRGAARSSPTTTRRPPLGSSAAWSPPRVRRSLTSPATSPSRRSCRPSGSRPSSSRSPPRGSCGRVAPAPGRSEIRYEIFHDVLAPAVLDWRARRLERRRHAEEQSRLREQVAQEAKERAAAEDEAHRRRKRARILAAVATVAAVAALAAIAIAIVAIKKQREADDAKRRSEVSNLVRDATLALRSNPALALHSAASAVTRERSRLGHASEQTVAALRQAVRASSLALQLEPGAGAVRQAIFTTEGDRIVTVAEGRLDLWSPADGRHVAGTDLKTGGRVLDVAAAGGTVVAGMSDGQVLSWRPGSSPRARAPTWRASRPECSSGRMAMCS